MPLRVLSWLMLCCCLLASPAWALDPDKAFRHYVRDNWSVPEGLPQISTLAIAQTPDGYIWAGTQSGLARFDGAGFTTFTPGNEPALRHLFVRALAVGPDGALWIGTYGGMAVYRDGAFEEVPWAGPGDAPLISTIRISADGQPWAATTSGVTYVEGGRLHRLDGPDASRSIAFTPDGVLWAVDAGGRVQRWDGRAWAPAPGQDGAGLAVQDLLDVDGEAWAATGTGLYAHGPSGWRPVPGASGADGLAVRFVFRDRDGNIWAGGDRGLLRIRPDGSVETVRATPTNGLANLFTAFEDREGNLWLGSLSNGLSRVRDGWTRRYSTADGLAHGTVWSLVPDPEGNGIWASGTGGVARLGSDGRFVPIPTAPEVSGTTLALLAEPGRLWIGLHEGVALYDPASGRPATVPSWARDIRGRVRGLTRDSDGHLWIGTDLGLARWDGSSLEWFDESRGLTGLLADYGLAPLSDGRRLALTRAGLFEFDGSRFTPAPEGEGLPMDNVLFTLNVLSDDSLLLSDLGDSLLFRHQGRWHRVDPTAGLPAGNIFRVFEHAGSIWISNMSSVYRLAISDLRDFAEGRADRVFPQVVLNERGLPNSGQQGICCNGAGPSDGFIADGTLWVPTRDGALAIDIGDIRGNPHPPSVHLGRVRVGDDWRTLDPSGDAVLEAAERDLTLTFDILSFQEPRSNQARYRLRGYDQAWRTADPMVRKVRYTNLPPGDYAFEVMGSNNSGVWTAEPARLEFSIRPWFHETLAFRLLIAGAGLLLVYAGFRYQRRRYRLRQAELERLVDERTEELAESNRQLEQASLTDPLTGLHNRRYLVQQIPADLSYYDRQLAAPPSDVVVFSMLDLDHFKQVNDAHGHAAGDRVLEEAAARLQRLVRAGDYVVRWGGEEFLLVFRPMPAARVAALGERLRSAIGGVPFDIGEGRSIRVSVSVGLAEYPLFRDGERPLGWEAMVELADQALYHVKRNGRDGWAMFRPTATTPATLLADLQRDPARLLREGRLELVGSVAEGDD